MTDEDVADLLERIDELERSNKALWAWVKTLVSQDALILECAIRVADQNEDWISKKDKIIDQVANNAIYIRTSDLENGGE